MTFSKAGITVIAGAVLLILLQVLYDPISSARHFLEVSNTRKELPLARAKWDALGITGYTFEMIGDGRSICQPSARIEVQNDAVVKVELLHTNSQILPPEQWVNPDWGNEVFLCNYKNFTMPQIFELVDLTLQNFPSSILQADFDSEYGFVTSFKYGIYVGYGLARPQISDCCNVFRIQNFQTTSKQVTH